MDALPALHDGVHVAEGDLGAPSRASIVPVEAPEPLFPVLVPAPPLVSPEVPPVAFCPLAPSSPEPHAEDTMAISIAADDIHRRSRQDIKAS
jgi:hypothetical protein